MASLTHAALAVVSKYLNFGKTSSLLVTSVSALSILLLINIRKKKKGQKELSENEMTRFLMSSEKVMKMIQDSSFLSDIDVSLMCGAGDLAPVDSLTSDVGQVTLGCEAHEETWTGAGTGQVATHHQELWRLTSDISCHQLTAELSHDDMSVSGLQWQYTDKGQWHEAWSDYGSLGSDQEDFTEDDTRMLADPLDWDVSRISLAEDGVL